MRIVRRGFTSSALRMRMASIITMVPALGCYGDPWSADSLPGFVRPALLDKPRTAGNSPAAAINYRERLLVVKELAYFASQPRPRRKVAKERIYRTAGNLVVLDFLQRFFVISPAQRIGRHGQVSVLAEQNDLACQLAFVFLQVFGKVLGRKTDHHADYLSMHRVIRSRRPGFGIRDESRHIRRGHAHVNVFIRPAASKWPPGLKVGIDQPEFGELVACPFIGALHVGRAGQAGAYLFKKPVGQLHDFGIMKSLIADLVDHVEINFFLGKRAGHAGEDKNANETNGRERPTAGFNVFSWFWQDYCTHKSNRVARLGQISSSKEERPDPLCVTAIFV